MSILKQNIEYMQLWDAVFLFTPTILDAILIFDIFFKRFMMQFLKWHGLMAEEDSKGNKRYELFASHACIILIFAIFSAI